MSSIVPSSQSTTSKFPLRTNDRFRWRGEQRQPQRWRPKSFHFNEVVNWTSTIVRFQSRRARHATPLRWTKTKFRLIEMCIRVESVLSRCNVFARVPFFILHCAIGLRRGNWISSFTLNFCFYFSIFHVLSIHSLDTFNKWMKVVFYFKWPIVIIITLTPDRSIPKSVTPMLRSLFHSFVQPICVNA